MKFRSLSISEKLKAIIMATSIFVLVLSSAVYIAYDLIKLRSSIVERLITVARIVANNCSAAVAFDDRKAAEEVLSAFSAESHVISAGIYRKNGDRLAEYFNNSYASAPRRGTLSPSSGEGTQAGTSYAFHGGYIEVSQAITLDREVLGVLHLNYSLEEYLGRSTQHLFISLGVLLFSIFAAYLLSARLQKVISEPILAMAGHMKVISRGKDYPFMKQRESKDEIGTLIDGFNEMLHQIKLSQDMIIERDRRLKHLLTSAPAVIYSCKPHGEFAATYVSDNVVKLLGYAPQEFTEDPKFWVDRIHPEDLPAALQWLKGISDRETDVLEYRFKKEDGSYVWVQDESVVLKNKEGYPKEIIGYLIDVQQRKELEKQLVHNALHDRLTGLPNRALFTDRLNVVFARAKRYSRRNRRYMFAVLYIDLDRFKNINDSMGHQKGDELLVSFAQRLRKCIRTNDTIARLGGDEFSLVLDEVEDQRSAEEIAGRVLSELEAPFDLGEHKVYISASIGIALSNRNYQGPEDLVRDADTALYKAKKLGKARYVTFDDAMHFQVVTALEIETDLREALKRDELVLHYQPIVLSGSKAVSGFEALARWNHPRKGRLCPSSFIPAAEETGMIEEIGRWVIHRACADLSRLNEEIGRDNALFVSVNLSAKQFSSELIGLVQSALAQNRLDPGRLKLEVTETTIMHNPEMSISLLLHLKEMNVEVYVDDFGTGYSSLSYLQRLPLNALKIDHSFISLMASDQNSLEIVKSIVSLAHNLRLEVIAEGVEDLSQAEVLERLGCRFIQGFAISEPLNYHALLEFLKAGRNQK